MFLYCSISESGTMREESERIDQERLDSKCFKLLRVVLHNEIVKLPDGWELNRKKHKR